MVLVEILVIIIVDSFCFYKWYKRNFDHFAKQNVSFVPPSIFGFLTDVLFRKEPLLDELVRNHKQFKNSKFHGIFQLRRPVLVVHDLDLIKKITVKDFEYFRNHPSLVQNPEDDPLFFHSIFYMKNDKWKDMRETLTPAFNSSNIRMMFELINETCKQAVTYLKDLSIDKPEGIDLEMNDFFTLYTNDVIASTTFGKKLNSLTDKNNEFYIKFKKATNFNCSKMIKFMVVPIFKSVFKFLKIKTYDENFVNNFYQTVIDTMKYRSENSIIRPDLINMLIEARSSQDKPHNREWTDTEIVAQFFIFLFAGYESTATALCFAAHEIMENKDVQERLLKEIDEVKSLLNRKSLSYQTLQSMKYLDMVICESLRKWPPAMFTDRICTRSYTIKTDDIEYDVKRDDHLHIPIVGIHYDEEYFPNPKKFDPERFSDIKRSNLRPFSYMPFGAGPRLCIGSRLAIVEAKAILYYILCNFRLEAGEKTNVPIKLANDPFSLKSADGFWMKLIPRK